MGRGVALPKVSEFVEAVKDKAIVLLSICKIRYPLDTRDRLEATLKKTASLSRPSSEIALSSSSTNEARGDLVFVFFNGSDRSVKASVILRAANAFS